mgnify:CR=1 FL=1
MSTTTSLPRVPLCDLAAQFEHIGPEIRAAIEEVLESQRFIMGPQVGELESTIAEACGATHAVGCSSGSDALLLSLMGLGIGPGDEVITTPFTFFATAGAVARLQARPVFVDIDPDSFCLAPQAIEAAITPRTRAILPVHLYGQCADMDPILAIAQRHQLAVIEDAAQAILASDHGRSAGSIGTAGCFSFFPSKNLGGTGDGGMVITSDSTLAEAMKTLRVHGARQKYFHEHVGANLRLDTLHAAVLLAKWPHLETWNQLRREAAGRYRALIEEIPHAHHIRLPVERPDAGHVYNQFVIRVPNRDHVANQLKQRGISTAIYYPLPLHMQECFAHLHQPVGSLPHSEQAASEVLALPMFPEITPEQQIAVVSALDESLA